MAEKIKVIVTDNQERVNVLVREPKLPVTFNSFNGEVEVLEGSFIKKFTAGENVLAGQPVYYNADGKVYGTDASDVNKSQGMILIALADTNINEIGRFLVWGFIKTSGLTKGARYHLAIGGGIQVPELENNSDAVTRFIGYALEIDEFWFTPSQDFIINL